VLQQLPGRVGKAGRYLPPQIGRDSPDNLVKAGVRVLPLEETSKARADLRVLLRSRSPYLRTPLDEEQVPTRDRPRR
jgi:hypothetical protein